MPSVLISGANRGIGLELARQYAADVWTVHATLRDPASGDDLRALGSNVHLHRLEVTDPASIAALAEELKGVPIDVLIANSGITGDLARPAELVDAAEMIGVMEVNTFGPLALAAGLKANLAAGKMKIATAMSSLMSSIGANDWGTQHVYRASKTALNSLWAGLAREWKADGITCVLLRPGYVQTRMTNFQGLDPVESVAGMRRVVAGLSLADSGRIIGYDGLDVPW